MAVIKTNNTVLDSTAPGIAGSITVREDALLALIFPPNYKGEMAYKGHVKSISSINTEGAIDILPMHENFVTMVKDKITLVDEQGKTHEFSLEKAVLEASNNVVKVFIEF